ncbi:MAG: hypothetical protein AAF623_18595 [Planctomycetota bacterium]
MTLANRTPYNFVKSNIRNVAYAWEGISLFNAAIGISSRWVYGWQDLRQEILDWSLLKLDWNAMNLRKKAQKTAPLFCPTPFTSTL